MDKPDWYEKELREAIRWSVHIPSLTKHSVEDYRFVGAAEIKGERIYYYYDPRENQYYYETESDRRQKAAINRKRFAGRKK